MIRLRSFILLIILTLAFCPFFLNASSNPAEPLAVTFSPQAELDGYLSKLISVIDASQNTLEIALYGLNGSDVYRALQRAAARGVQIRMLYENAPPSGKKPAEPSPTLWRQVALMCGMSIKLFIISISSPTTLLWRPVAATGTLTPILVTMKTPYG